MFKMDHLTNICICRLISLILHVMISSTRSLEWCYNGIDSVSKHQPHDCLLNRLFRRRSNKTSKPRVTGLCEGNSPETGEFPVQMASNAETFSIWWRHHGSLKWFISIWKKSSSTVVSTVFADDLAPLDVRASAGRMMTKFGYCIYT